MTEETEKTDDVTAEPLTDAEIASNMLKVAIDRICQRFPNVQLHVRTVKAEISFVPKPEPIEQPESE